jgi:glucokinase
MVGTIRPTVTLFLDILASVAEDAALCIGATGGVHLAGGIVPRIAGLIDPVAFRRRFEAKGRITEYARDIPAFVVVTPHSGLIGASVQLSRDD